MQNVCLLLKRRCDPECKRRPPPPQGKFKRGVTLKKEAEILKRFKDDIINRSKPRREMTPQLPETGESVDFTPPRAEGRRNLLPALSSVASFHQRTLESDQNSTKLVSPNHFTRPYDEWVLYHMLNRSYIGGNMSAMMPLPGLLGSGLWPYSCPNGEKFWQYSNAAQVHHWSHIS